MTDFYDFLQISPNAEGETIHRVYLFLASRFHPDNQESGDVRKFHLLKTAYDVLSDPARRAQYDATRKVEPAKPLSTSVDFLDNLEGELNRRMAVLAVLYYQRRRSPNAPEVSLREIEERMGFPRDYLDFTLWYLHKKNYITKADNAQFTLTAEGVDFVEAERARRPILNRLLASSSELSTEAVAKTPAEKEVHALEKKTDTPSKPHRASRPIVLPVSMECMPERRKGPADRRTGAADLRLTKVERRKNGGDRRANAKERKKPN